LKIALLSDAHGNARGLQLCLAAARELGAEEIHFLGDAVGYMPEAVEVLELLRKAGASCVLGNHEAMLIGRLPADPSRESAYRHNDARRTLGPAGLSRIAVWPEGQLIDRAGRRLLLVHGSPADPLEGRIYPDTPTDWLADVPADIVAVGHTHRPFIAENGSRLLVNVGSCGMPRDEGNALGFAMYDTAPHLVTIYRIRIDPEELLARWDADAVDDLVRMLFRRRAPTPLAGTILERPRLPWTA
jgi:putative phosphoesterase